MKFKPMLLKELLKSKGLKQKWLADKIGISEVTDSTWCSGKSVPKKVLLHKISELIDVPVKQSLIYNVRKVSKYILSFTSASLRLNGFPITLLSH